MNDPNFHRLLLSPRYDDQAKEFYSALDVAWRAGSWCVVLDELFYLDRLGLRAAIERLLTQGRSKDITVVSGMQRPVQVTRFALAESTHLVCFGAEGRDRKTIGDVTNPKFAATVASLKRYEFAWYYRPDRQVWTGKLQDIVRTAGPSASMPDVGGTQSNMNERSS